ncbi:pentapeptide repeat-containing protein [Acidocella sp.]|jgi:uncharacterized protein YjbI with pentapeptide repeats|uniref:pentapeptide repeat-containing protein n=1 Tax=Acidocella sp. TaxID=50710 RepID=UPI0038D07BAE
MHLSQNWLDNSNAPQNPLSEPPSFGTIEQTPYGINFDGANLALARLTYARLISARMHGVYFDSAILYGPNFEGADVSGASFDDADVTHADFGQGTDASNITQTQLDESCSDPGNPPILPQGLKPPTRTCSNKWEVIGYSDSYIH